ncbi:bumetanide-sensitive sodium-(potassium)-chloride cotransporter isoform X2 [Sitodiplosis mosellana]|uniref:bumetanide-sensitive sodium-(potassium)-chloride cotransporter isoform X2 n=1 Tax=Sitodiplosis mosellana TaxID=263140 RepID=UPI0024439E2E|nr:bumetanide-sensitive sodium-(potassium)-chloride cotransporter isoform X2 [Sitodiplosis mosellana]
MSKDYPIELIGTDRPNRFQVNPVTPIKNTTTEDVETEAFEEDTFDDDDIVLRNNRRSSRLNSLSLRSSFRDKDKPAKYKDIQTTRFQVPRNDDSDSNSEDRDNLLEDFDTNCRRSFLHFTREALPRLDNYRDILSVQAVYRPTLDDLHNATMSNKQTNVPIGDQDVESEGGIKFGWIKGVLMRCILNIWGVMLFLRLSWVVAQAGVIEGCLLIITTTVVTTITALSMSAISTNGVVKGGGTYYMISRSLGPEFGGSIGLIFSLANAVACAMYVVGFCESLNSLLNSFGVSIFDGDIQDRRILGSITIIILLWIVVIGMEWEAKAQIVLLCILLLAIADFFIGTFVGPKSLIEKSRGFIGYNATTFKANLGTDYRQYDEVSHNFFSVFAIFFPAATGILAGANISGDLKDPSHSIPKGTILAIFITSATYIIMAVVVGSVVVRDATGHIEDAKNGSFDFLNCTPGQCQYGLHNSFEVIELVSLFGPLIYAGCFAATLSSALASLVSAPKVFQALCKDKLYPKIQWFARGYGKNNEPVRGYILTFIISIAFILIGDLNAIAPLISNFFLAAYMLVNFSTFHASLAKPVGWRPTFKYYNMWLSLLGAALCVAVMFLISWSTALLTFAAVIALYLIVSQNRPDVNWGSTTQAQTYKNALLSVLQLNNVDEHVKNYRPQILVLSGLPSARPILIDFADLLTKKLSLLICGHIIEGTSTQRERVFLQRQAREWFKKHKVKGFYTVVDGESFENGARALLQASGVGKLKPNIVLMGYKQDWQTCTKDELQSYFDTIHKALDMHMATAILRVEKGLDYSRVLGEDNEKQTATEEQRIIQTNDSTTDLLANSHVHGSNEFLSRIPSQASSISDLSVMTSPASGNTRINMPSDPNDKQDAETQSSLQTYLRKTSKRATEKRSSLYTAPNGDELPKYVIQELTQFTCKRNKAIIDVYWLYDDGGLTLLLPYIISRRRNWESARLRVFALANKKDEIEVEMSSMASLLAKFRIDYSDLELLTDITKKAEDSTYYYFKDLIRNFTSKEKELCDNPNESIFIEDSELLAVKDKTNRYLRLRENLLKNSMNSDLIVMTLPMPRKNVVSAPLYMAWLESLSRGLPPLLFVRGNQTSVLTFYS